MVQSIAPAKHTRQKSRTPPPTAGFLTTKAIKRNGGYHYRCSAYNVDVAPQHVTPMAKKSKNAVALALFPRTLDYQNWENVISAQQGFKEEEIKAILQQTTNDPSVRPHAMAI